MRIRFRFLAFFLAFILSLSCLAACDGGENVQTEPDVTTPAADVTTSATDVTTAVGDVTTAAPSAGAVSGVYSAGLAYSVNGDGVSCTIVGIGTCTDTELVIGGEIDGYTVTAVADRAFKGNQTITKVTISDTVTKIGASAFGDCSALTEVEVPEVLEQIAPDAFEGCDALKEVPSAPDTPTPPEPDAPHVHAFSSWVTMQTPTCTVSGVEERICACGEVESRSIEMTEHIYGPDGTCLRCPAKTQGLYFRLNPDGESYSVCGIGTYTDSALIIPATHNGKSVTAIGASAFSRCTSITSVTVSGSVTSIGASAFSRCTSLQSVVIDNGVTTVGEQAFMGCSALSSVSIAESVTSIGSFAFEECGKLKYNKYESCKYLGNAQNPYLVLCHADRAATSLEIHADTRIIAPCAFEDCAIASINVPARVVSVGERALAYTPSLAVITVDESNPVYYSAGNCIIERATGLLVAGCATSVIPDGVSTIANDSFVGCANLTAVIIPDGVKSIGEFAFYNCTDLTDVRLPDSIERIGQWAFENCNGISFAVHENCKYLGNVQNPYLALYRADSSVTSVSVHSRTRMLADSSLINCNKLTQVKIPQSVVSIGKSALANCESLTAVTYDGSRAQWSAVKKAENWDTRTGEYTLTCLVADGDHVHTSEGLSYKLNADGEGYTVIGIGTCTDSAIVIPATHNSKSVTAIGASAFEDRTAITSVTVPESVTSIGASAFMGCIRLERVELHDGITSIGTMAFCRCISLKGVAIPKGLAILAPALFEQCGRLEILSIPEGVVRIGDNAFLSCGLLSTVYVPASVKQIAPFAFYECASLKKIFYSGSRKDFDSMALVGIPSNCEITCLATVEPPENEGLAYTLNEDGQSYSVSGRGLCEDSVISIPSTHNGKSVTAISPRAFLNDAMLSRIIIPDGIKSIGNSAFFNCLSLTDVDFGNGVKSIGATSFAICGLTAIELPASVESIGIGAFAYSTALASITVDESNPVYYSAGNCIIERATGLLVAGCATSAIPDGVTKIGDEVFAFNSSLTSISIAASVTAIGERAFCACDQLTSIRFGGTTAQWAAIEKGKDWDGGLNAYTVYCTDGNVSK